MPKKLTLNIEEELVEFAHQYARKKNKSISKIVEEYLRFLKESEEGDLSLSNDLKTLYGILAEHPLPDKKTLREEFHEKSPD